MSTANIFTLPLLLCILAVFLFTFTGCLSVESKFINKTKDEFVKQPLTQEHLLTESDIEHLPGSVRKYIVYSGAIGKGKVQNWRATFDAQMIRKPGAAPMTALSEQYNFYGNFTRIFLMKATMFLVPFRALHIYADQKATFVVRVASLYNVVNISGQELTSTETVTLLNDMCLLAPGSLADQRLSWKEIDSLTTRVTIDNGPYKVSAVLFFNRVGELVNFVSEDRSALQDNGTMKKTKWSTPIRDYKDIDGRRICTYGEAIWNYPEGDFTYGKFTLKDIQYNVRNLQ